MLPNKMKISESATNSLSKFKGKTGLTVNVGARLAFFTSIERGFRFDPATDIAEHSGRELDKHTWLGNHDGITEQLLNEAYPSLTKSQLHDCWAAHIDDGTKRIEHIKDLRELAALIQKS